MTFDRQTTVAQMRTGDRGRIIEIAGGYGLTRRLEAMGIRPGKKITKVSSMLMHGPVTVQVDGVQVAIGFGMARRILVELGSK
jgi:ferrous iron transport protein A